MRKRKLAKRREFLPPPLFVLTGMHHQDAIRPAQIIDKARQIRAILRPVAKIINPGEPVVGVYGSPLEVFAHLSAEPADESCFQPWQPASPDPGNRHAGVAD